MPDRPLRERLARHLNPTAWRQHDTTVAELLARGWDVELGTRHLRAGVDQSLARADEVLAFFETIGIELQPQSMEDA